MHIIGTMLVLLLLNTTARISLSRHHHSLDSEVLAVFNNMQQCQSGLETSEILVASCEREDITTSTQSLHLLEL